MEAAKQAFESKDVVSVVNSIESGFGILFYENGCNRGKIWMRLVERMDHIHSEVHGIRYWSWIMTNMEVQLSCVTVVDFVVPLPEPGVGKDFVKEQFTMVTKEWDPSMLDNFDYSRVGIERTEDQKIFDTGIA